MYMKAFLLHLIKARERTSKKKKRRDEETRKHKLEEIGPQNMKEVKQTR